MKKLILFGFLGLSVSFIVSCGGEEEVKITYDYEKTDSLPPEYTSSLGNIRVSVEDAAILNKMLKDNGYSYNSSILNSSGKNCEGSRLVNR